MWRTGIDSCCYPGGHGGGDRIIGRSSRSAIGTLVDRASRYVKLVHLPGGHSAEQLHSALNAVLDDLPDHMRWTLSWDQGSAMAHHHQLANRFRDAVFFAHPASPWQRPTIENTNGLVRQYFPKDTDVAVHDAAALHTVEDRINHRPRKLHNSEHTGTYLHSLALCHYETRQRCDDHSNSPLPHLLNIRVPRRP